METNDNSTHTHQSPSNTAGRILGGMVIIIGGSLLLARSAGAPLPDWLFRWPVFLIGLGLFLMARNAFRRPAGLILILIGSFFLAEMLIPNLTIGAYFWPVLMILGGILYMFKRGRHPQHCNHQQYHAHWKRKFRPGYAARTSTVEFPGSDAETRTDPDAFIEITTIFGGTKKKVLSKNFKGGEVVTVFGGTEIDMSQAEINGPVILELTQVFGGTKLIIPAHWQLQSEMVTILGGMDDKRNPSAFSNDASKTLILQGTIALGGIDIRSFH